MEKVFVTCPTYTRLGSAHIIIPLQREHIHIKYGLIPLRDFAISLIYELVYIYIL